MLQDIFSVLFLVGFWFCYRELKLIAADTRKKEEIADSLDRLTTLLSDKKGKVVSFVAKEDEKK